MKTNTSDFTITISKNDQALIDNLKYLAENIITDELQLIYDTSQE